MAEGATAGDEAVMAADMAAAAGAVNPDASAAGGPGAGGAPLSPAEAKLAAVAQTFLQDMCGGLNREMAPNLTPEHVQQAVSRHLAPDAVVHVDGLLHSVPPVVGHKAFFDFITMERAAYRTMTLDVLLVAVTPTADGVFALSHFKMKNVGPWRGCNPTRKTSEGFRIDELRFNEQGQIAEAWCNRQLFEEERELLLRDPDRHHPAAFDPALLVHVPLPGAGQGGLLAPEQLLRVAQIWAETWNMAAAAGPPDPDSLEALVEPDFIMLDALGFTGDDAQSHPYTSQRACSIYIFDFEAEFPDLGRRLAPNAPAHRCNLSGLASTGGVLFKRSALQTPGLAARHTARGVLPARFSQHAGPWWLAAALAASPNIVTDIRAADVIYVDDFCYAAWSEAKVHDHGSWLPDGQEDLYVDPDTYLREAYQQLLSHPAFVRTGGANFVFFHTHPAFFLLHHVLCQSAFADGLHLVPEAGLRRPCGGQQGGGGGVDGAGATTGTAAMPSALHIAQRMLLIPHSSFPMYESPAAAAAAAAAAAGVSGAGDVSRPYLVYFRGSCTGRSPGKGLRAALVAALQNVSAEWQRQHGRGQGQSPPPSLPSSSSPSWSPSSIFASCDSFGWEDDALLELSRARYCVVLPGDTAASRRLTEAVLMGCVPVFVGPPYSALPLSNVLRYDSFALAYEVEGATPWLPGGAAAAAAAGLGPGSRLSLAGRLGSLRKLPEALRSIGQRRYEALSYHLSVVRPAFSFTGDAVRTAADVNDIMYSRMCFQSESYVKVDVKVDGRQGEAGRLVEESEAGFK